MLSDKRGHLIVSLLTILLLIAVSGISFKNDERSRNALSFDGKENYLEVSNDSSLNIDSVITVSVWIYPFELYDWPWIIQKYGPNEWAGVYSLFIRDGYASFRVSINATVYEVTSITRIQKNHWQHIVGIYNGSLMCLYINNGLVGTIEATGNIDTSNEILIISRRKATPSPNFFNGLISDIRIYSRPLIKDEINDLYHGDEYTLANDNALVLQLRFKEGKDCIAFDSSHKSNDGILKPDCPDNSPKWSRASIVIFRPGKIEPTINIVMIYSWIWLLAGILYIRKNSSIG